MRTKKIDWRRLAKKGLEDGIKKAIELVILAMIIGATMEVIAVAVPAVAMGSIAAKLVKIQFLE